MPLADKPIDTEGYGSLDILVQTIKGFKVKNSTLNCV